jgi:hypothetical protein
MSGGPAKVRPEAEEMHGPKDEQFHMRAPAEFFEKVDDWRRRQDKLTGRSEAVRRLVGIALALEQDCARSERAAAAARAGRGSGAPPYREKEDAAA